jgi:hypothetical protein
MNGPTSKQQDLCGYCGAFGALIALTCIIQLLIIANVHWIAFTLLAMYLFIMSSFTLLALQKPVAPLLLIISSVLSFIAEATLILTYLFSVIVIVLFIYCVTITAVIFVEQIPKRLKEKAIMIKAERKTWAGKI